MAYKEIIKALECCSCKPAKCDDCPCMQTGECFEVGKYAIDLINRQKAEIEQLEKDKEKLAYSFANAVGQKMTAKSEAIKEVIEGLKSKKTTAISCDLFEEVVRLSDIESIINEIVGDAKIATTTETAGDSDDKN